MKRALVLVFLGLSMVMQAQNNSELQKHYEAYYKQMKAQGDVQGIINGLTHLNVLSPSQARLDTLSYIYMNEGKYLQALNTIGIDSKSSDSNIAVEVKAVSLKALGQPDKALVHFNEMYKRKQSPMLAYELAELNLQLNNLSEATKHINYGLSNATDEMNRAYYETQQPYQVPLKAGFMYLKGLVKFNENKTTNIDAAVDILDEALKLAPNFNLAQLGKNALLQQKTQAAATKN